MRETKDECSFVSLRDVERTVRVMLWFYDLLPKLNLNTTGMCRITHSLILSIAVCYRAKLRDRAKFDSYLTSNLVVPLSTFTESSLIKSGIDQCQTRIINLMKIEAHIARNSVLTENLFMMFVCIQLKIPLFIVGKPGSSKSLARSIINHSFNEGLFVGGHNIRNYDHLYMQCYQCSQYTTSAEIVQVFSKCQTIQQESAADSVACVVLDEVGLAEDSPNLPLKVLHSLLEDSEVSGFAGKRQNVSFIGLSNWALDPAKMNRGIMVQLEDPTPEELVKTAHAIIDHPSDSENEIHSSKLTPYLKSLADGYLAMCSKQTFYGKDNYFGLRDFYCLVKMLYSLCRDYNTALNRRILLHGVKRNFGGIPDIDVVEIFGDIMSGLDDTDIGPLSDPLSLFRANVNCYVNSVSTSSDSSVVKKDSNFDTTRYLLLLTENVAMDILFQSQILDESTKIMFGSSFPMDKESYNICHNIISGYRNALKLAEENVTHHVDTILFFDEANTSHTIGLIKEVLCDRRIDGETIPTDLRLQFIAACNPYRKHSEAMIDKLTSAGLGMLRNEVQTREQFGDIPLRDLVYRVIPLPKSLLPLVWDFGELSSEAEKRYIIEIIHIHIHTECHECFNMYCDAIAKALSSVQKYMRETKDECSFVSLRDVERTVRVMLWFYDLLPKLNLNTTGMCRITHSLILSIAVCYRAKLRDRAKFDSYLTSNLVVPLSTFTESSLIKSGIDQCQTRIINLMKIEAHIARNSVLTENLFMMFVCIQLKIPLFIVGKPGSSKSLARSIPDFMREDSVKVLRGTTKFEVRYESNLALSLSFAL